MPIFHLDFDDLPPIIDILEEGLLNKPEPEGFSHYDLDSAIYSAHAFDEAIEELSKTEIAMDSWDFQRLVEQMVEGYHALWAQPFPEGLEEGQYLFSAMLEKVLKELLKNLKSIVRDRYYDDTKPLVYLDAEKEVEVFNHWLENRKEHSSVANKSTNWSLVLAAGLFGYWLGSR